MKKKLRLSIIVLLGIFLILMGGMFTVQAAPYFDVIDLSSTGYLKDLDPTASDYNVWQVWNGALRPDYTLPGSPNAWSYIGYAPAGLPVDIYYDITVGSYDMRAIEYDTAPGYVVLYLSSSAGMSGLNVVGIATENPDGSYSYTDGFGDIFLIYTKGSAPNPVPEPATMLLLGLGLIGVLGIRRKSKI